MYGLKVKPDDGVPINPHVFDVTLLRERRTILGECTKTQKQMRGWGGGGEKDKDKDKCLISRS